MVVRLFGAFRRLLVVLTEGGDLCPLDKGILLKNCEIEEQGDLGVGVAYCKYLHGNIQSARYTLIHSMWVQWNCSVEHPCNERNLGNVLSRKIPQVPGHSRITSSLTGRARQ